MAKSIKKFEPKMHKAMHKAFSTAFNLNELTFMLKELEFGMDVSTNTIFFNDEVNSRSEERRVGKECRL